MQDRRSVNDRVWQFIREMVTLAESIHEVFLQNLWTIQLGSNHLDSRSLKISIYAALM